MHGARALVDSGRLRKRAEGANLGKKGGVAVARVGHVEDVEVTVGWSKGLYLWCVLASRESGCTRRYLVQGFGSRMHALPQDISAYDVLLWTE